MWDPHSHTQNPVAVLRLKPSFYLLIVSAFRSPGTTCRVVTGRVEEAKIFLAS